MTRRLLSVALLGYLGLATWLVTGHFSAWGDGLSTVVGQVIRQWTVTMPLPEAGGGIDFVECHGCTALPGSQGFGIGLLALLVLGVPLALLASWQRRHDARTLSGTAAWYQTAFVLQCASVSLAAVVCCGGLALAEHAADLLHWIFAVALADLVVGVPAVFAWRHLHARAFGAPRPLLSAA